MKKLSPDRCNPSKPPRVLTFDAPCPVPFVGSSMAGPAADLPGCRPYDEVQVRALTWIADALVSRVTPGEVILHVVRVVKLSSPDHARSEARALDERAARRR